MDDRSNSPPAGDRITRLIDKYLLFQPFPHAGGGVQKITKQSKFIWHALTIHVVLPQSSAEVTLCREPGGDLDGVLVGIRLTTVQ